MDAAPLYAVWKYVTFPDGKIICCTSTQHSLAEPNLPIVCSKQANLCMGTMPAVW